MKKLPVLAIAALMSVTASASNWVSVGYTPQAQALEVIKNSYVDTDSIVISGNYRKAFSKHVFTEVQTQGAVSFDTIISLDEYNCTRPIKKRLLSLTMTLNGIPTFNMNSHSDWLFVIPDSINESLAKIICSY